MLDRDDYIYSKRDYRYLYGVNLLLITNLIPGLIIRTYEYYSRVVGFNN